MRKRPDRERVNQEKERKTGQRERICLGKVGEE